MNVNHKEHAMRERDEDMRSRALVIQEQMAVLRLRADRCEKACEMLLRDASADSTFRTSTRLGDAIASLAEQVTSITNENTLLRGVAEDQMSVERKEREDVRQHMRGLKTGGRGENHVGTGQ